MRTEFPVFAEQFANFANEINDKLAAAPTMHEQTRADIMAKYNEIESYFAMVKQLLAAKAPHEDTGLTIDEVQVKFETFKQTVNQLFNAPPPKQEPPKAPEAPS